MVLSPQPQKNPEAHHRKRQAGHHKRSKPYHKTYWPYLPLLAIAGFALLLHLTWSNLAYQGARVLGSSDGLTNQQLLEITNVDRSESGIDALTINDRLSAAAQAKADDMAQSDYWSHTSPEGSKPQDFVREAGYSYRSLGENLAYGFSSPDAIVQGWMNSPEHKANMLDPAYHQVGFGVATAESYQGKGRQTIVVALYGTPKNFMGVTAYVDNPQTLPAKTVSRSALLPMSDGAWLYLGMLIFACVGGGIFIGTHLRSLYHVVTRGRDYIVHHPLMDVLIIIGVSASILLTRTAGFIQ